MSDAFQARFTDMSAFPFIRTPALTALRAINKALYNEHDVPDDVLEKFLDNKGKDVELKLSLLTWQFDAQPSPQVSDVMVGFFGAKELYRGYKMQIDDSNAVKVVRHVWRIHVDGKEPFEQFLDGLIDLLVSSSSKRS
jgi:hypothetical protein